MGENSFQTSSVFEVNHLSRSFGKKQALHDVSLSATKGSVLGLVGKNGAGKTTLIKHLLGLLKAQSGSVRVFGMDPVSAPEQVLGRVGYLSEDRDLPRWMSVSQFKRYTQAFYPGWDPDFAERLHQAFELEDRQRIGSLSRGQTARVGLLAALAHRPELLILDEPSSGLDPVVRLDILTAIVRTVADEGRNVLFSSHLLDEVERVADFIAVIDHGRIIMSGPLEEILTAHQRLTLRYENPRDSQPTLPGALSCSGQGKEWTVLCNGEVDALVKAAADGGAEIVDQRGASLEEIFVARVSG
jgi:ABC-2 type transport system ATP-binding protein